MRWNLGDVAAITGGHASGSVEITSVSTDSRDLAQGALFVALAGEFHDGHSFIGDAMTAGAAACLVAFGRLPADTPGVEVADPLAALGALGAAFRGTITTPVVAITGSSGKTTTKDMTAGALGPGTHCARHSYNNEIGVPLTILSTPREATAVVVEVGSRGVGHIAALAGVIRPDVSVITNIGPAHLEAFGDVATVAVAKWELIDALGDDGVAVLPAGLAPAGLMPARVITFGDDPSADLALEGVVVDGRGRVSCTVRHLDERAPLRLRVPGLHQALDAAAALAVAVALDRDLATAVEMVATAPLSRWRMEVTDLVLGDGTAILINDAYNANPASMSAALETVAAMAGTRHIAILGKMHELGRDEASHHADIGSLAARLGFSTVVVVGDDPGIAAGAGDIAVSVPDAPAAVASVAGMLSGGDVVVVKASRASGLEEVATGLERMVGA
jgi:UDP-N-acetylmuramoyl-tripeptide--D-alanyl-D-alanine ligase